MSPEKYLRSIAEEIARLFFKEKESDLSELVAQAALERELNDEQIKRVIEFVNHLVRNEFYRLPDVNQAAALFEPASYEKVIQITKKTPEGEVTVIQKETPEAVITVEKTTSLSKEASVSRIPEATDYYFSPSELLRIEKMGSTNYEVSSDPGISNAELLYKALKETLAELEHEYRNYSIEVTRALDKAATAGREFLQELTNYLRMHYDPFDVIKMAATIDKEAFVGLDKQAAAELPEDIRPHFKSMLKLVNTELPANFIIESSPLVIKFKGYATARREAMAKWNRFEQMENEIRGLKEILTEAFTENGQIKNASLLKEGKTALFRTAFKGAAKGMKWLWGASKNFFKNRFARKAAKEATEEAAEQAAKQPSFWSSLASGAPYLALNLVNRGLNTPMDEQKMLARQAKSGNPQATNQFYAIMQQRYPKETKKYLAEVMETDKTTGLPKWMAKSPVIKGLLVERKVGKLGTKSQLENAYVTGPGPSSPFKII